MFWSIIYRGFVVHQQTWDNRIYKWYIFNDLICLLEKRVFWNNFILASFNVNGLLVPRRLWPCTEIKSQCHCSNCSSMFVHVCICKVDIKYFKTIRSNTFFFKKFEQLDLQHQTCSCSKHRTTNSTSTWKQWGGGMNPGSH